MSRRRIVRLIKVDAAGFRWRCPIPGEVVVVHVGPRRIEAGNGFWACNGRIELVAPAETAWGVVETN